MYSIEQGGIKGFIKNVVIYHAHEDNKWLLDRILKKEVKEEKRKKMKEDNTYKIMKNGK